MLSKALQYIRHQCQAKTRHGVHSPFVYAFVNEVLPKQPCPMEDVVKGIRRELSASKLQIEIEDFGAGYSGRRQPVVTKTTQEVMRSSARRPKEGGLLYRICKHYAPASCLELGTNLGFSTLYQAGAVPSSRFISIEGSGNLAKIARENLAKAGIQNVELIEGEFMDVLKNKIDWGHFHPQHVLLDGNHREQATLDYFEFLLPRMADGGFIILDDIYWSAGMTRAWNRILRHPEVSVSMDLWDFGICVVRRPQSKEHFSLRF